MPQSAAAPSPFPPIADYAFLSNCHTGALVAPDGAIDWLCVPRFDSPSVFGSLLDREAGAFRFGPFGINVPTARIYEPGTNTLGDDLAHADRLGIVRDALTIGPRPGRGRRSPRTLVRPPTRTPTTCWCGPSLCLEGRVEIELICEPAFDYGRRQAKWSLVGEDRHAADASGAGQTIRLQTGMALGIEGNACGPATPCTQGEQAYCSLSWAEGLASPEGLDEANARIAATTRFWREWLAGARMADHRCREPIQRSALAIKGLTYMPTGATVAALTTSLPETPGGERNWDYRFTWIRDSTFTLQALHYLNLDWEADEFMQFVADLEPNEDGALQIMYGIDGRRDLTESTRDDLSGYAGASPVRIGNGAFDQRQNDVFGAALDSILLHTRRSQRLPRRLWPIVQAQAECATAGLAQARSGDLGGARRAAALRLLEADVLGRDGPRFEARRDPRGHRPEGDVAARPPRRSREDILEHGVRDGVLRQHYETDALDASTLLAADVRLPAGRRRASAQERARRSPTI